MAKDKDKKNKDKKGKKQKKELKALKKKMKERKVAASVCIEAPMVGEHVNNIEESAAPLAEEIILEPIIPLAEEIQTEAEVLSEIEAEIEVEVETIQQIEDEIASQAEMFSTAETIPEIPNDEVTSSEESFQQKSASDESIADKDVAYSNQESDYEPDQEPEPDTAVAEPAVAIDKPQMAADLFQSEYTCPSCKNETVCLSCAQAILLPYCKDVGLDEEQSLHLGRGFAMGMMNDSTCGALIAAIMLAGLSNASLNTTAQIFDEFLKRYGSTLCKDILEGPGTCRDIIKHACLLYEKHASTSRIP